MPRRFVTAAQVKRIRQLKAEGFRIASISRIMKMAYHTVRRHTSDELEASYREAESRKWRRICADPVLKEAFNRRNRESCARLRALQKEAAE